MTKPKARDRKRSRSAKKDDDSPDPPSKIAKTSHQTKKQVVDSRKYAKPSEAAGAPRNESETPVSEATRDATATPTKRCLAGNRSPSRLSVVSPEVARVKPPPSVAAKQNKAKTRTFGSVESDYIATFQARSDIRGDKEEDKEETPDLEESYDDSESPHDVAHSIFWGALLVGWWNAVTSCFHSTRQAPDGQETTRSTGSHRVAVVKEYLSGVKALAMEMKINVGNRLNDPHILVRANVTVIKTRIGMASTWVKHLLKRSREQEDRTCIALNAVNRFFHASTGPDGCILGGLMRVGYALFYLIDRVLWPALMNVYPERYGLVCLDWIPNSSEQDHILQLASKSALFEWIVNYLGLVQGLLLLLGISPRFQVACILLNLCLWQWQNSTVLDSHDVLLRTFAFLLCFLPLHRVSICGWWHTRGMTEEEKKALHETDSWPMWPFRLWQLQTCFIYSGIALAKFPSQEWTQGIAMSQLVHTKVFGTLFCQKVLSNRLLLLKSISWSLLVFENICWILIWPTASRIPTLIAVAVLHAVIGFVNMNISALLAILGWSSFLVRPEKHQSSSTTKSHPTNKEGPSNGESSHQERSPSKKWLFTTANVFVVAYLVVVGSQMPSMGYISELAPARLRPAFEFCRSASRAIMLRTRPWLRRVGLVPQRRFIVDEPTNFNQRLEAIISFDNGTKVSWWSPDFGSISGWKRLRNRRRAIYWEHLISDDDEAMAGQARLCRLLAQGHGKGVAKIKLVAHFDTVSDPLLDIGRSELTERPQEETVTETRTTFIFYPSEVCNKWKTEGYCRTDVKFMLKRCPGSCNNELATPVNIEVGSRIEVYWEDEYEFYSAKVKKIQDGNKTKRFLLEWDSEESDEWYNLDKLQFRFVGDSEDEDDDRKEEVSVDQCDDTQGEAGANDSENEDDKNLEEEKKEDGDNKWEAGDSPSFPRTGQSPLTTGEEWRDDSISSPIGFAYVTQKLVQQADAEVEKLEALPTIEGEEQPPPRPAPPSRANDPGAATRPSALSPLQPNLDSLGGGDNNNMMDFASFPIGFQYVKQRLLESDDD